MSSHKPNKAIGQRQAELDYCDYCVSGPPAKPFPISHCCEAEANMNCDRCGTSNPVGNKFCGNCGASLDSSIDPVLQSAIDRKIDAALASKLTDQRIVAIDVQENVIKRLTDLAKIVGIPIALLLAVLSLWGIKSLSDVDTKITQATNEAIKRMNSKFDAATEQNVANLKAKVDNDERQIVQTAQQSAQLSLDTAVGSAKKDIETKAAGSEKRFDDLRAQVETQAALLTSRVQAQDAKLSELQNTVSELTARSIGTRFEGIRLRPYRDPDGRLTIGSSHGITAAEEASGKLLIDGKQVDFKDGISTEQAEHLLQQDLNGLGDAINKLVTVKLTENQRGALEDFVFQMGINIFRNSSILKELNAGNYAAVPRELMKYTKLGNRELPAFQLRRKSEVELWNTP